jgi:hypothetical protein
MARLNINGKSRDVQVEADTFRPTISGAGWASPRSVSSRLR